MHTHTPPSTHSPPAPGDPMMLKRTLLHASMPGNLVLNERISCLFKDTTQPAAEPPREGPPGSTCSLCTLPHGEDPGGGWGRQDRPHQPSCASFLILPGTTADTSSRHSQLHGRWFLQGRRGANHRSGRVYSCEGIQLPPGWQRRNSWAGSLTAKREPGRRSFRETGWGGELGTSDPPCQGHPVEELFSFSH